MTTTHTDAELIKRILAGDEGAFSQLVDCHHATMVRVARAIVRNGPSPEEVAQDTWVAVLKSLHKFQQRSSLKTWIFKILTNRAKTLALREARSVPFSAMEDKNQPAVDPERFGGNGMWTRPPQPWAESPEQLALRQEVRDQVVKAVAELPERQRLVVTLRDLEGWTAEEVCEALEVEPVNQRVLLHRARSKVRQTLESFLAGQE